MYIILAVWNITVFCFNIRLYIFSHIQFIKVAPVHGSICSAIYVLCALYFNARFQDKLHSGDVIIVLQDFSQMLILFRHLHMWRVFCCIESIIKEIFITVIVFPFRNHTPIWIIILINRPSFRCIKSNIYIFFFEK